VKKKNAVEYSDLKQEDLTGERFHQKLSKRQAMEANIVKIPSNFQGKARRIAKKGRKYHSGIMWLGVTRGFASIKLSG
jgi:hypothetical protein